MRTVVIYSEHPLVDLDTVRGERLAEDIFAPGETDVPIAKAGEKLLKKTRERLKKHGVEIVKIRTEHLVPYRGELLVSQGMEVRAGDPLTTGPVDPAVEGALVAGGIPSFSSAERALQAYARVRRDED